MKEKIKKAVGQVALVIIFAAALAFFSYNSLGVAVADVFRIVIQSNRPATSATSTVSHLRYVVNGSTTTLPSINNGDTAAGSNNLGFNVADAYSVTLAYQTVGSTSPYTLRFEVEYGYDIPITASSTVESIQWFKANLPITGPLMGYNIASTSNLSTSELASTTHLILRGNLGVATTSEMFNLPTYNARYMRVNAAALGSNAMIWLNAIIKNSK